MSFGILGLYLLQVIIFNEIHLRRKNERVSLWTVIGLYVRSPFSQLCKPITKLRW
jgi:hypothetical protein